MDTDLLHGEFVAAIARLGGNAAYARVAGVTRQAVSLAVKKRAIMPGRHVVPVARALGAPRSRFRPDLYPPEEEAPAAA